MGNLKNFENKYIMTQHKNCYSLDEVALYEWKTLAKKNIETAYYLLKTESMVKRLVARDIADIIDHYSLDVKFVYHLNDLFKQAKLNGHDLCKIAQKNHQVALIFLDSQKISSLLNAKQKATIILQHCHVIHFTSELKYGLVKQIAFDDIEAALILLKADIKDEIHLDKNDKLNIFHHHNFETKFSDLNHLLNILKHCHLDYLNNLSSCPDLLNKKNSE
jgi:hypothetical protein